LAAVLDERIAAMSAVLEALQSERAALERRDAEALSSAVSAKQDSVRRADALPADARSLLAELGGSRRRGGGDPALGPRWQQLIGLTEQCRALNDGNGLLINGQRRIVDQALCLLRGQNSPPTYGADGAASGRPAARTLASI
jgi:flagellar biosynthesis/type III secretory pathway chaperone